MRREPSRAHRTTKNMTILKPILENGMKHRCVPSTSALMKLKQAAQVIDTREAGRAARVALIASKAVINGVSID